MKNITVILFCTLILIIIIKYWFAYDSNLLMSQYNIIKYVQKQ